jgi:hypothetical protein
VVVLRIYELSVVVSITSCYHCKIEKAAVVVFGYRYRQAYIYRYFHHDFELNNGA